MEKLGYLLLLLCIYTVQGIGFKGFVNLNKQGKASLFLFLFISSIFMALSPLLFNSVKVLPVESILYALLFGISLSANLFFYGKALESGPLAYSALFNYGASVVPMLFGLLFWNESMGTLPIIGCFVIVAAFYLMTHANSKKGEKFSIKWLIFCLVAFAANAAMLLSIKLNQRAGGDGATYSLMAAIFSMLPFLCFLFYFKNKEKAKLVFKWKTIVYAFMFGVPTSIGVIIFTIASSKIATVVLYPVVNGGLVVTMTLISIFIFKDKINKLGIMGLVLGLIAVILFGM